MTIYEWRLLQRRERWTMGCPYEEWFRPIPWDYSDKGIAVAALKRWRELNPDNDFKLQSRVKPTIREWKDLKV